MTQYENLLFEKNNSVGLIKINRADKLNALNKQTLVELNNLLDEIKQDNSIKVVIITGIGDKAFVAGADIEEINKLNHDTANDFSLFGQSVFNKIENFEKPIIAAINGYALGGGCELAMACHLRFASNNAKFAQPEVKLGIIPGFGGTQRLSRLIGLGKALELILSGDMISADEAKTLGLVNSIYEQSELLSKAIAFAEKISQMSMVTMKLILQAVQEGYKKNLSEGLKLEARLFAEACSTEDFSEGTSAFLQKRPAHFIDK